MQKRLLHFLIYFALIRECQACLNYPLVNKHLDTSKGCLFGCVQVMKLSLSMNDKTVSVLMFHLEFCRGE